MAKLPKNQREILEYLARCGHSTTNIMRRVVFKRPVLSSLRALERRGLVSMTHISRSLMSSNLRWEITDEGLRAAGYKRFRVWFMSANHAIVIAPDMTAARQGPWSPSFGSVVSVEELTGEDKPFELPDLRDRGRVNA